MSALGFEGLGPCEPTDPETGLRDGDWSDGREDHRMHCPLCGSWEWLNSADEYAASHGRGMCVEGGE